jgi:hypothetical protein
VLKADISVGKSDLGRARAVRLRTLLADGPLGAAISSAWLLGYLVTLADRAFKHGESLHIESHISY